MEGFQQIEDVHSADFFDFKFQPHEISKKALIVFFVDRSLIVLRLPVGEVLHQLLGDRFHVEAAGADGNPWKVEAGHWHGGVLQGGRDQVLLPVVIGSQRPVGSPKQGNYSENDPKQSVG